MTFARISRRATRRLPYALALTATLGCAPRNDVQTPKTAEEHEVSPLQRAVDPAALQRDVAFLADDGLQGRHSLSPSLQKAAAYLAEQYQQAGLVPLVGDRFEVPFQLPTGARASGPSMLDVSGTKRDISADAFAPSALGVGGQARGSLVFVGYGLQTEATPEDDTANDTGTSSRPAYDDFAGVDVSGKIAVILQGVPATPDMSAMETQIREISEAYAGEVAPLLAEGDDARAMKLHADALGKIGAIVKRALRGQEVPSAFFEAPESAPAALDLGRRLMPIFAALAALPGPQFDFRAASTRRKIAALEERGAIGVLVVRGPNSLLDPDAHDDFDDPAANRSFRRPSDIPVLQVSWKAAETFVRVGRKRLHALQDDIDAQFTPASGDVKGVEITMRSDIERTYADIPNLVGVLPGRTYPDEFVVVGGHYDHIGADDDGFGMCRTSTRRGETDTICNGADDNASGSAVVLAAARAFQQTGTQPERSIIFAHFAGEELGLLGSRALVERDDFPTDRVKAMINLDMVGRARAHGVAIGGIQSSESWMPLLDEVGTLGMKTIYEAAVAGRSDHANFYTAEIPVLFFFTGLHADYHRAGDNLDRLDLEGMHTIASMVFGVLQKAADGRAMDFVPPTEGDGIASALPGTNPDTIIKTVEAAATPEP